MRRQHTGRPCRATIPLCRETNAASACARTRCDVNGRVHYALSSAEHHVDTANHRTDGCEKYAREVCYIATVRTGSIAGGRGPAVRTRSRARVNKGRFDIITLGSYIYHHCHHCIRRPIKEIALLDGSGPRISYVLYPPASHTCCTRPPHTRTVGSSSQPTLTLCTAAPHL
jgi:hypothetical protein